MGIGNLGFGKMDSANWETAKWDSAIWDVTCGIGLYTTCYLITTTTTVFGTLFGDVTTIINCDDCVDSATTGYIALLFFTTTASKSTALP